jgi:hypothetical protein
MSGDDDDDDDRRDALAALERQCRLAMGLEAQVKASSSRLIQDSDVEDEEDEWNGIQDDNDDDSDHASGEEAAQIHAPALVTVFSDPSSSRQRDSVRNVDNFMVRYYSA